MEMSLFFAEVAFCISCRASGKLVVHASTKITFVVSRAATVDLSSLTLYGQEAISFSSTVLFGHKVTEFSKFLWALLEQTVVAES